MYIPSIISRDLMRLNEAEVARAARWSWQWAGTGRRHERSSRFWRFWRQISRHPAISTVRAGVDRPGTVNYTVTSAEHHGCHPDHDPGPDVGHDPDSAASGVGARSCAAGSSPVDVNRASDSCSGG
jgi:hypothetical protein